MSKTILHLTSIEPGVAAMFLSDINDLLSKNYYSSYLQISAKKYYYLSNKSFFR